jgi:Serine dehydrogenase proteinase
MSLMNNSDPVLDRARVREVTGVFYSRQALDAATNELLLAGFDRSDVDVLNSVSAIRDRAVYIAHEELADVPDAPRWPFIGRDDVTALNVTISAIIGAASAMGTAFLGPIDPQIGQSPAASLIKVVEEKPVARIDDQTLVFTDVGRKAISQLKQSASELLEQRLPAEQASALAEKFSSGTWTHDYPIWASTAKSLGLPVSTEMPSEVLELMKLYPQPVRMQSGSGGVEYLPVPRHRELAKREA